MRIVEYIRHDDKAASRLAPKGDDGGFCRGRLYEIGNDRVDELDVYRTRPVRLGVRSLAGVQDRGCRGGAYHRDGTHFYNPIFTAAGTDFSSSSAHQTGRVAGAGLEYAVTDHWSIKGEYLHVGVPNKTFALSGGGLNYKF
jgi:opacity protein-like surface antigen